MRYWYAPLRPGLEGIFTSETENMAGLYVGEISKKSYDTILRNRRIDAGLDDEFGLPINSEEDDMGLPT